VVRRRDRVFAAISTGLTAVRFAGQASPERQGMWANFDFVNLVQYNDGFKTGLIGTAEQVADRIRWASIFTKPPFFRQRIR
jgi:hypothetical protein